MGGLQAAFRLLPGVQHVIESLRNIPQFSEGFRRDPRSRLASGDRARYTHKMRDRTADTALSTGGQRPIDDRRGGEEGERP